MIDRDYLIAMASYNRWQNDQIYAAAGRLDEAERKAERGAFFGSIHATLNHLLWADQLWMSRFAQTQAPRAKSIPESTRQYEVWQELAQARTAFDRVIADWARSLDPSWLQGELTWFSGAMGREVTKPTWVLAVHLFNHQTHHRGQVHALLTAAGERPGDTDLPFMPDATKA